MSDLLGDDELPVRPLDLAAIREHCRDDLAALRGVSRAEFDREDERLGLLPRGYCAARRGAHVHR